MGIIIALISVSAIAAVTALIRRTGVRACPLCVGVSLTWAWLLLARAAGYIVDPVVLGLLMGGSAVGVAYQLQKRLPERRSPSLFLAMFTIAAFALADGIVDTRWGVAFAGALGVGGVVIGFFLTGHGPGSKDTPSVTAIEKKLENCCN